jgi:diguanylate cyclase (GGDEF)-like protein
MTVQRLYRPKEICQKLEISARQLGYWRLIGVVKPRKQVRGSKVFHYYSEKDFNILKEVRGLTARGYFVSKAAQRVRMGLKKGVTGKGIGMQREKGTVDFEERFKEEWSRSRRFHYPISCLLIWFESFQSMKASQQQRVIQQLEEIIFRAKRVYDVIARTGENEFIWLLPKTGEQGVAAVKSRVRSALQAARLKTAKEIPSIKLVHFGTASALPSTQKIEDLAELARQEAKRQ